MPASRGPQSVGADGSAHSAVFTGATSFQGQFCERGVTQCGHSPMEQDSEQLCGWGALRPRALQVFNSPRWVLFFLFDAALLQGMIVHGFIGASVTSIERRFDLSSSQMGLIVSSFDIASCICLPFVSYFGGSGHKPRWLGWGVGVMGLGSLVFALPHFTTPPYQVTAPERSDMCSSNTTDFSLNKASDGLSNYFYVFVLGQLLHGIGATPLYTLGFTFLDENVKPSNSPLYMGIFYTAAALGPSIGFLLGGYLLSFFTEITLETELTPASPLWVGAWWIGFILGGTLCLPVAFVILGYPKKLPGPQSVGADGSAHSAVFTGATSFQGQFCERGVTQCGHSPMEQDSEQLCGWGALRPRALQVFNSPRWVLFFLFDAALLQGMIVHGFIGASVTSIERRFDLSSSQMGLIVSSFDIASCICLPFVSYFGGSGHKPRWLGWGVGVMGLGSLVFALPHFTTPPYQVTAPERSDMCSSNTTDFSLNKASDGLSNYFYVFVLGQLLHGIGATPLYTLGFTFLDENVKPSNSPLYMGIFYTAAALGPSIGFLLGGYLLSFFTEITLETELTPASPLWVGAWWIGFILGGTLCLPVAFVILGYPKKLPGSRDIAVHQSETHQSKDGCPSSASHFRETLKDMLRSLLLLLSNPVFMFLCLAGAAAEGLTSALTTFMIKYFESQFGLASSKASLIFGALTIPTTAGGTFFASCVVKRFKLQLRGIIRFCMACALVGLLLIFSFFISCPTVSMAGVTVPYPSGQRGHREFGDRTLQGLNSHRSLVNEELVAQCNANCSCDRDLFSPVCGDGVMFYSPCFAGCSSINLTATGEVFADCSCVGGDASWGRGGLAEAGKCAGSCSGSYVAVFMTCFAFLIFCKSLFTMPNITATLRCVPERQKSFALGIQGILVRTLGYIPGPIVFGSLMDQACLLWQSEGRGSCYLYENSQMSHFTLLFCVIYQVLVIICFILAHVFYKAPPEPPPISAEDTDFGDSDLHRKTPPEDGAIAKLQTRL